MRLVLKQGFYCIGSDTGRNPKILKLSECELSQEQKKALLGLYAFGGMISSPVYFKKESNYIGRM